MMEKIIQYGMATGNSHNEVAGYVNEQIAEGWQPYGVPFTTIQHNTLCIHQAMVIYEVKKKSSK
ncbi:MAG: DUF1737 domain-containing protein [Chitinophagaceae bacterium]|nr:MAG: DUF1737 domain-containing protein [Chitinophagaceae bacterium]